MIDSVVHARRLGLGVLCMLMATDVSAQALGDYSFRMPNGFEYSRCNEVDTVISNPDGEGVFTPYDFPGVGPIVEYAFVRGNLLLHTCGRKRPEGETLDLPDPDRHYFFIIRASESSVSGPFSSEILGSCIPSGSTVAWLRPEDPLAADLSRVGWMVGLLLAGVICTVYLARRGA